MPSRRSTLAGLVERTTGVARGATQSARDVSMGLGQRLGRGSYVVYNVSDYRNLSQERKRALGEMVTGRALTRKELQRFKITPYQEGNYRERTRPTDRLTGERLSIYRPMNAFKITLS